MRLLGFEVTDIGPHSIWKGAISYLASLPGGPPIPAVCIQAGWRMGNIRDIYMRYISSRDQFISRCLSMLPLLRTELGSSPPHFVPAICDWADDYRKMQFSMLTGIAHFSRMTLCVLPYLHIIVHSSPQIWEPTMLLTLLDPSFVMVMHSHMLALVQPLLFHIPGCQMRPSWAFLCL